MINIDFTWGKICADNDQQAFSDFFDYFYPRLFNFSLRYVRQPSAAEEVVSDVIYNLLKDKNKNKDIERISSYLYQSVKNKSLNWLRDQKKHLKLECIEQVEDYLIGDPDEQDIFPEDKEIFEILEEKIQQLPVQRQMVYRLLREDRLLTCEVAELLSLSKRTVEKHLELAIKELCKGLKEHLQDQRQHPKIRKMFPRSLTFLFF